MKAWGVFYQESDPDGPWLADSVWDGYGGAWGRLEEFMAGRAKVAITAVCLEIMLNAPFNVEGRIELDPPVGPVECRR